MSQQHRRVNSGNQLASTPHVRETTMAKKLLLLGTVAALALGSTSVWAADLPMKAAPPLPPPYDPFGQNLTADGFRVRGGLAGGTVGFNWQISSLVLGFEGDLSWVGEYGSHNDDGISANASLADQSFTKETWLGTARVRAGYAVNNLLFYGTGGWAGAGVDAGMKSTANNALVFSSSSTRSGWTAGAGLEWGFAPNWSAKWEWLYMKFDNKGFVTALGDGTRSAVFLDDWAFRAGINYRFGGPVVAKY
jgi:outer membrane immunogenic protein